MNKCRNPEHPHCTVWVMPGEAACQHGHRQAPQPAPAASPNAPAAPDPILPRPPLPRPHLHVSGFDPRAAGGRQALKLELRGMPMDAAPQLAMLAQSALVLHGGERHTFTRTLRGDWRPVFIEFSSRGVEHGQHRIELELHSRHEHIPGSARSWVCTLVVNVPRPDATLADIHQAFLATHKNVRVIADDASIARVNAQASGRLDIEVSARDASIAQLNLDAEPGKVDVGLATIAWDEDLIEIDTPAHAGPHPCPARAACLVNAAPGMPGHVRLFAMDEVVLGRYQEEPEADLLLCHFSDERADRSGLTRRLSGRHAVIRRGRDGYQVEDVSRYGLLVDGAWPGKHVPVPLRLGMRIELTASIRGVVVLTVTALLPNGVILHRADGGAGAECYCLLDPERHPGEAGLEAMPQARLLPFLFHRDGGFWHLDPATGHETALAPGLPLDRLCGLPGPLSFAGGPYPEAFAERAGDGDRRRAGPVERRAAG
ncbi:MAG: FHA domain-containing protein [Massilia sp.]